MKRRMAILNILTAITLSACGLSTRTVPTETSPSISTFTPYQATSGTTTTDVPPPPTLESTPTLSPPSSPAPNPVYDLVTLGDLSQLDGYILTHSIRSQKGSQPGAPEGQRATDATLTIINHPLRALYTWDSKTVGISGQKDRTDVGEKYWIGSLVYQHSSDPNMWLIFTPDERSQFGLNDFMDLLKQFPFKPVFAGEQAYQDIAAYQFVINETDISPANETHPEITAKYTGNIYLAKDGNYPLHLDYQRTGLMWWGHSVDNPDQTIYVEGINAEKFDVTSINQVKDIPTPPDSILQVKTTLDVPLPPGAALDNIMIQAGVSDPTYTYLVNLSTDQIFAFYKNYQPSANGWSVGEMMNLGTGGTVILQNANDGIELWISYDYTAKAGDIQFKYTAP